MQVPITKLLVSLMILSSIFVGHGIYNLIVPEKFVIRMMYFHQELHQTLAESLVL